MDWKKILKSIGLGLLSAGKAVVSALTTRDGLIGFAAGGALGAFVVWVL